MFDLDGQSEEYRRKDVARVEDSISDGTTSPSPRGESDETITIQVRTPREARNLEITVWVDGTGSSQSSFGKLESLKNAAPPRGKETDVSPRSDSGSPRYTGRAQSPPKSRGMANPKVLLSTAKGQKVRRISSPPPRSRSSESQQAPSQQSPPEGRPRSPSSPKSPTTGRIRPLRAEPIKLTQQYDSTLADDLAEMDKEEPPKHAAFAWLDTNGDGVIDRREWEASQLINASPSQAPASRSKAVPNRGAAKANVTAVQWTATVQSLPPPAQGLTYRNSPNFSDKIGDSRTPRGALREHTAPIGTTLRVNGHVRARDSADGIDYVRCENGKYLPLKTPDGMQLVVVSDASSGYSGY